MGKPKLPPITEEDYENMKRRVRVKWEPALQTLARDRQQSELAARGMRAFGGVAASFDHIYERRLRQIHESITREIEAIPKPKQAAKATNSANAVLGKLPARVRNYITDSIDQQGLKITDDTTLKWMADVVSQPADRQPSIRGAGVEFRW